MSQQFQVVKCCQCLTHQVDIKKKSTNKWDCKMCGQKQQLQYVYLSII
jgi:hypothetical protein